MQPRSVLRLLISVAVAGVVAYITVRSDPSLLRPARTLEDLTYQLVVPLLIGCMTAAVLGIFFRIAMPAPPRPPVPLSLSSLFWTGCLVTALPFLCWWLSGDWNAFRLVSVITAPLGHQVYSTLQQDVAAKKARERDGEAD